jgi:hypothetical protein
MKQLLHDVYDQTHQNLQTPRAGVTFGCHYWLDIDTGK